MPTDVEMAEAVVTGLGTQSIRTGNTKFVMPGDSVYWNHTDKTFMFRVLKPGTVVGIDVHFDGSADLIYAD